DQMLPADAGGVPAPSVQQPEAPPPSTADPEARIQPSMPGAAPQPAPLLSTGAASSKGETSPIDTSSAERSGAGDELLREFLAGAGIPSAVFPGPLTP